MEDVMWEALLQRENYLIWMILTNPMQRIGKYALYRIFIFKICIEFLQPFCDGRGILFEEQEKNSW